MLQVYPSDTLREDKPQHHDKRCDKMFITVDWSVWHTRFQIRQCTWYVKQDWKRSSGVAMAEAFRLKFVQGWNDYFSPLDDEPMPVSADPWLQVAADMRLKPATDRRPKSVAFSLSLRERIKPVERFQFVDSAKSEAVSKKFVPKNTEKITQWALSTFLSRHEWRNARFAEESENLVPWDVLVLTDPDILSKWLTFLLLK